MPLCSPYAYVDSVQAVADLTELIAIAYPDEGADVQVKDTLARLQRERLIELDDAVVVVKGQDGKVRLDQSAPLVAAGAAGGAL